MIRLRPLLFAAALSAANAAPLPPPSAEPVDFVRDIQPVLNGACLKCHGPEKQKGAYRVDVKAIALTGGENHAPGIRPGNSADSPLIHFVAGLDPDLQMPPKDPPLGAEAIGKLRRWIDDGAAWPDAASAVVEAKKPWWSLQPVVPPPVPAASPGGRNAVDAFLLEKLHAQGLTFSPEAGARTLCRRVYFDLTGLPPLPEEVEAFVRESASRPDAWEQLVDRLLASPRYGERWARHWLDVVHFGETHGYDKDQPRPNAWPYRDYVIRAFNGDKPYARFISEQLAGDALYPETRDGIEALGFISAGPWDFIGHAEVPESKTDGKIARHLDRDDMVANTLNTFCSLTVHCAQCHDHKFDPIKQEDYYRLQSVFAALDRADRLYDPDPAVARQRAALTGEQKTHADRAAALLARARLAGGESFAAVEKQIEALRHPPENPAAQSGWHSGIGTAQDTVKWVQADLGASTPLRQVVLHPCHDDFNGIGDGFGFPLRFKIEACNDPAFTDGVTVLADETARDYPNPKIQAVTFPVNHSARYLRITATRLAPRQNDFIFALAELEALTGEGRNAAAGAAVTSLDSIEAPPRWQRTNLTDRWYPGVDPARAGPAAEALSALEKRRREMITGALGGTESAALAAAEETAAALQQQLAALPAQARVYAGTVHAGSGNFTGTGASGGKPRPVFVLSRGDVTRPGSEASPGAIAGIGDLPARFDLPPDAPEHQRRAALARWITDPRNPLTWRSIVNRVWQYHFGRGLAGTPSDFGKMGQPPSHPELLDWLAADFRDHGGSLKRLHRLLVTSAAYRQSPVPSGNPNAARGMERDGDNTLLWHMNRRKLEAEAVRDSILSVAGMLDLTMGGPSFQDFVITHPEHSPHYEYQLADLENPVLHRRSVYRFLVRSKPQPWMASLDCADPSMAVERRNQTITPLQALAQLNNQLALTAARRFAERVQSAGPGPGAQMRLAWQLALQRDPTAEELEKLTAYARAHGTAHACRVLLNLNEFTFID